MFKKIDFKTLNYRDLDRLNSHDIKRDSLHSFYQTFDFLELIKKWPDIIGEALSKVTSPLKIQGDSLIIVSSHASYSQNISFLSEELKKKIFHLFPELMPKIKRLNFVTKESFFIERAIVSEDKPNPAPRLHPQDPRVKILRQEADRLFADVEDSELRSILTSIFVQTR